MIHQQIEQKAVQEGWLAWHQWGKLFLIVRHTGSREFSCYQWRSDLLDSVHNIKIFSTKPLAFKYFEERKKELDIIAKIKDGDEETKKEFTIVKSSIREGKAENKVDNKLIFFTEIDDNNQPILVDNKNGTKKVISKKTISIETIEKRKRPPISKEPLTRAKKSDEKKKYKQGWFLTPAAVEVWDSLEKVESNPYGSNPNEKAHILEVYLEVLAEENTLPEINLIKKYGSNKVTIFGFISLRAKQFLENLPSKEVGKSEIVEDFLINKVPFFKKKFPKEAPTIEELRKFYQTWLSIEKIESVE